MNSYAIITQIYFILIKMSKLYSISQAAKQLGVAVSTLRRWEYEGKLIPHALRAIREGIQQNNLWAWDENYRLNPNASL